jgi:hypothetical protein
MGKKRPIMAMGTSKYCRQKTVPMSTPQALNYDCSTTWQRGREAVGQLASE